MRIILLLIKWVKKYFFAVCALFGVSPIKIIAEDMIIIISRPTNIETKSLAKRLINIDAPYAEPNSNS